MLQKEQKEKAKPVEPKAEVKDAEPEPEKVQAHVSPMQNPLTPPQEAEETSRSEDTQALPQAPQESTEAVNETEVVKSLNETTPPEVQVANGFVGQQNAWFGQQDSNQMEQQMQQMFPGHDFSGPNGWNMYNQMMQGMHHDGWMSGYGNSMMGYGMNSVAQGGGYGGGGNFGGMGMNGGGFHNGHDGMGWGWNGQNNVGYNPGMEGTRNGGYYSAAAAGGYNHQSHGNLQMPTQQYQNPHFRQQPYQRGRGGFGNGSRPFSLERQPQQAFQDAQFQQQFQGIDEARAAVGTPVDEKKGEKIPVVSGDPENITDPNDVPTDTASTVLAGADLAPEELADSQNLAVPVNPDMAQYFPPDEFRGPPGFQPHFPAGPRGGPRGGFRGSYQTGRGGFYAPIPSVIGDAEPDKIPGVGLGVEGAPTGPKALREGIPPVRGISIRGAAFGRGRGTYAGSSWNRSMSPGRVRPLSRSRSRDGGRRSSATGRDRSRDPSRDRRRRSRSRNRDRSRHRKRQSQSVESESDRRGRTLNPDTEEPISPVLVKTLTDVSTAEQDNIDSTQQSSTGRVKRSREESASRERLRSISRSRSKSPSGHHKRSRRHRRSSPVIERDRENRDKEPRDRDSRDKDSSRHHRRGHKHRSSRRHHSHSRSRSPKKDDYPIDEKTTTSRNVEGVESRNRRDSRERRHKRRSKREDSRHRSHRHKSSKHDRYDKYDKDEKYDRDERYDKDEKYDRREREKHEKTEPEAITEKKTERERYSEKDADRKTTKDTRSRRKPSYKYEDEEDLERRAERDREAERWGGVKK